MWNKKLQGFVKHTILGDRYTKEIDRKLFILA
jgi:hypothetical protein